MDVQSGIENISASYHKYKMQITENDCDKFLPIQICHTQTMVHYWWSNDERLVNKEIVLHQLFDCCTLFKAELWKKISTPCCCTGCS